jgi:hypothetical protein
VASYTNRATFLASAGATTVIDFSTLPQDDVGFPALTISGVTFHDIRAFYGLLIYGGPKIRVDLPPNTRAVGADIGTNYADPGVWILTTPTGTQAITTSAAGNFIGLTSDTPVEWVEFRFFSYCVPFQIYGAPTCSYIPPAYANGVGAQTLDNFTFGPGM